MRRPAAEGPARLVGVLFLRVVALLLVAVGAQAQTAQLDLFFDVDRDAGTGCSVATADGPVAGIELRLRTGFDVGLASVDSIETAPCLDPAMDLFGAGTPVSTAPQPGWLVEAGEGLAGSTLVETHLPLAELGVAPAARVFAQLTRGGDADALLSMTGGGALELSLAPPAVPGLGWGGGLLLLAGIAVARPLVFRTDQGRPGSRTAASLLWFAFLVGGVAVGFAGRPAWALLGDGVHRIWNADEQLASDPSGDAPLGADLLGLFAASDFATGELWLRADVAFGPAVCLEWGQVDPGTSFQCGAWPPLDPSPFAGPVALTFDDGPNPVTTPGILATLRANAIPATFFVVGDKLLTPAEQALALEIHEDPLFRLGTHTVDHFDMTTLTPAEVAFQVDEAIARVRTAIGDPCYFPAYFRFPFGRSDCAAMSVVRSRGQTFAGVNIDPVDWCYAIGGGSCPPSIVGDIEPEVVDDLPEKARIEYLQHGGGILLLHDIHATTAAALPAILATLQAEGATFVDLADLTPFPNLNAEIGSPEPPACCQSVGP